MKLSMVISLVLFVFASCGANRKDDSAATSVKSDLNTEVEIILNNSITGFVYRFKDARVPFQIFNDENINLNGAQLVHSGAFDRGAMSSLTEGQNSDGSCLCLPEIFEIIVLRDKYDGLVGVIGISENHNSIEVFNKSGRVVRSARYQRFISSKESALFFTTENTREIKEPFQNIVNTKK